MKVFVGEKREHKSSKFQVYAASVNSFAEVKKAYSKIKEANLAASHVPCGYRIFGSAMPFKQDFADDFDIGLGRTILNVLKQRGVYNIAVFVVRHFDGEHIGPARFEIVKEMTESILATIPGALNYGQSCEDQSLVRALNDVAKRRQPQRTYTKAVNGRGRRGGRGGLHGHLDRRESREAIHTDHSLD